MAKFSLVAVLALIAIAAVVEASTVTVTTVEEENPISRSRSRTTGGGCSQQMMDPQMLTHCMMYLTTQGSQGQSGSGRAMMPTPQEHMDLCCMELRTMMKGDEACMCGTLEMMMNQGWMSQQMMGPEMMSMAKNLPMQCGLMNQPCQMQSGWF